MDPFGCWRGLPPAGFLVELRLPFDALGTRPISIADLPAQVAALRKLLPTIGHDPETLAACFGRKNKKRTDQDTDILATLKALGHIA